MKTYLQCKKVETAINRATKILIKRAETKGIYENFGQDEIREIRNKFIKTARNYSEEMEINSELRIFNSWCVNYNG